MKCFKRGMLRGAAGAALAVGLGVSCLLATGAQAANPKAEGSETGGQHGEMHGSMMRDVHVTQAMLTHAASEGRNWVTTGRDYDNSRFSPLTQINTHNVKDLRPVAIVQTGYTASFETTPLVVNGVMYATTPMVNKKQALIAINAATGQTLWKYEYTDGFNQICCGPVNRGAAAGGGRVFFLTIDNHLVALDANSGKEDWKTEVANSQAGYSETMAPVYYDHMIIIGSAGGEWPIAGFVAAYDANTGKQIWRFHTTSNHESWSGDSWKYGGGTVWESPAIDIKRGLLIFSTGNPNPDLNGSMRKGTNLYTDSIIALNIKTGALKWYYQEVPHDVWDLDAVSPVVLFDAMDHGKMVPAAGEAGKTAFFYVVNRETGKLIRMSEPFDEQKNLFAQPTTAGVQMLPGANGGSEWSPPAYSPKTQFVYVLGMNQLMTYTKEENSPPVPGQIRLGSTFKLVQGGSNSGTFTAIDVNTGKIAWNQNVPQPMMGGALVTAGDVAFTGEGNGWFDAFNAKTGARLWRYNLGAGVNAPPITYEVHGRQYVAVAAGGNFQMSFPYGDAIAIFALDK